MFPQLWSRAPDVHVDPDIRAAVTRAHWQRIKHSSRWGPSLLILRAANADRKEEALGRTGDTVATKCFGVQRGA
jgi:hypothetical protein